MDTQIGLADSGCISRRGRLFVVGQECGRRAPYETVGAAKLTCNAGTSEAFSGMAFAADLALPHGISSRVWMSNLPLDVNDGVSGGREFACDYSVLA